MKDKTADTQTLSEKIKQLDKMMEILNDGASNITERQIMDLYYELKKDIKQTLSKTMKDIDNENLNNVYELKLILNIKKIIKANFGQDLFEDEVRE